MKTIQGNRSNESHSPPVNLHQLMKLTSRRSNAIAHRKNLSHMQYLQVHQKMNVLFMNPQIFNNEKSNIIRQLSVQVVARKQHHVKNQQHKHWKKLCNAQS